MKKKLFLLLFLCSSLLSSMAQINPTEKKLRIKEFPPDMFRSAEKSALPALNCFCDGNLFKDGSFKSVSTQPGGSDISYNSPIWQPAGYSPQYSRLMGGCDSGFIFMWGNQVVGEGISQSGLKLQKGKCYTLKFNARFPNNTGPANPFVQLAVRGTTSGTPSRGTPDVTSANISSTSWGTYSVSFTASANFTALTLFPVNGNNANDGAFVSWIQLDNVCLSECCECGSWKGFAYLLTPNTIKPTDLIPSEKEGKLMKCGTTLIVKAGTNVKLNPLYNCTGNNCQASFKTVVAYPNGTAQSLPGSQINFTPTIPGYHIISVTPVCNGKICPPCRIRVLVVPGCEGDIFYEKGEWESAVLAGEGRG